MDIPVQTLHNQQRASHPQASAWVSANAGSGKTFVLARRVVRLLLAGTDPARLLCLTFTKAAAAEMASRVFAILSDWTALDDAALADAIVDMGEDRPDGRRLARARRLFASALETPGGLKIQTIHGFCESLLHQFPLEANVAGHFTVLDERVQRELMAEARARVLHKAAEDVDTPLGRALRSLIDLFSDAKVESAVSEIINRRDDLYRWIIEAGTLEAALSDLAKAFEVLPGESIAVLEADILDAALIEPERCRAIGEALRGGGKTDAAKADALDQSVLGADDNARRAAYLSVFFTKSGGPFKAIATKKIVQDYPDIIDLMQRECDRLVALLDHRKAVATVEGTTALIHLADAVLQGYERDKRRRSMLDFEDLVVKTANLLSRSEAAQWVQYKLDRGLDHILVDEAQDTSPRQWQVIKALAEEFFSGAGARPETRTVFAVGDEKQSIYSFQGAVPAYFAEMRRFFDKQARNAQATFNDVRLTLSFRSTPDVLGAVDQVFADPATRAGLSQEGDATVHEAVRRNDPGLVEIWPLLAPETVEADEDWMAPLDRAGPGSPMIRTAERIAEQIAEWRRAGTAQPGDILVLLRKRGAFVEALNRALKARDVPVAGSDRLVLNDHIAVKDLVALGRFILLAEDDLSLAALLKSPLFGLNDDDLFAIAHDRKSTLWRALRKAAKDHARFRVAYEQLERWRARADFVPPYEFFARVLGPDGGRRRMRERLGLEVDDILDEFLSLTLAFESTGVPGLEGFLAWLTAAPTQVKREMDAAAGAVRVMTVHGAKGLEAPVVFLVDTGAKPVHASHDPAVLPRALDDNPLSAPALVWLPVKAERTQWHHDALEDVHARAAEEYRRLLYVAMTRARDRLVICGWQPARGASDECWHALAERGLRPSAREVLDDNGDITALHWQRSGAGTVPAVTSDDAGEVAGPVSLPDWSAQAVPPLESVRRLAPSRAYDLLAGGEGIEEPAPRHALDAALQPDQWGLVRGRLVHRLLQTLPDVAPAERLEAAGRYLDASLDDKFVERREGLLAEVFGVMDDPEFKELFTARARAEVPIVGSLEGREGEVFAVSGQIDRLVVTDEAVLIVDYKTNAKPPQNLSDVPGDYIAQLAVYRRLLLDLYPGKPVRAVLLWTATPSLMEVPAEQLETIARAFADDEDRVA